MSATWHLDLVSRKRMGGGAFIGEQLEGSTEELRRGFNVSTEIYKV